MVQESAGLEGNAETIAVGWAEISGGIGIHVGHLIVNILCHPIEDGGYLVTAMNAFSW
jgi:hypothetical protein